jgi:manganese transport protein
VISEAVKRAGPFQQESGANQPEPSGLGWRALLGPAFAVSIGYIDPGNWATDLAASAYGYRLLWVVLTASIIALILQISSAQLAIVTGDDLASLISRRWPKMAVWLGALFELAIIATDVAEFAGIVVGLRLLFHLPIAVAALLAIAAVAAIFLFNAGRLRRLELVLMLMLCIVSAALIWEIECFRPPLAAVAAGALFPQMPDRAAMLIAIGLIGATVMPHNLFLHSALVKEKCRGESTAVRARRARFFTVETLVALAIATIINAAILIVAVAANPRSSSFASFYAAIHSHAGAIAAIVLGLGLTISGLASSVAATLSSDYVVAAFSPFSIRPIVRRAIGALPAGAVLIAGVNPIALMLWSQAVLALILPSVIVPMLMIMASRKIRLAHFSKKWLTALALASVVSIVFDGVLIALMIRT